MAVQQGYDVTVIIELDVSFCILGDSRRFGKWRVRGRCKGERREGKRRAKGAYYMLSTRDAKTHNTKAMRWEGVRDRVVGCSDGQLERLLQEPNDGSHGRPGAIADHPSPPQSLSGPAPVPICRSTECTFFIMLLYRYHWWLDSISTTWSRTLTCRCIGCRRVSFIIDASVCSGR